MKIVCGAAVCFITKNIVLCVYSGRIMAVRIWSDTLAVRQNESWACNHSERVSYIVTD